MTTYHSTTKCYIVFTRKSEATKLNQAGKFNTNNTWNPRPGSNQIKNEDSINYHTSALRLEIVEEHEGKK
jgi:hypothetical protein